MACRDRNRLGRVWATHHAVHIGFLRVLIRGPLVLEVELRVKRDAVSVKQWSRFIATTKLTEFVLNLAR